MAGTTKKSEYMISHRKAGISGPLMFVIIIIAVILVMSIAFRISDIQVYGNEHYTNSEIINAIDIEEGDNLFFFDRFAAISRVFAKLPYVESVSITRHLPNRVIVDVVENEAIAYIKLGSELWTLDHNCKVLGTAAEGEEEKLVQITGISPGTLFVNERLTTEDSNERAVEYLDSILDEITKRGLVDKIRKIDMSNVNSVIMYYDDGLYTVKLGDPYQTSHKFALVESAISQLLPGDSGIIDVTDAATVHYRPY